MPHRDPLHALILRAIARYELLDPGDRVLVAVSGGQDSLALLHCLHALSEELQIALHVAHLNHGIRGDEAVADAGFVQAFSRDLGVPITLGCADVPEMSRTSGASIEMAGRTARREFLASVAKEEGCGRIALGHTATDRAETVLMNILRGSGLEGLRGIPPVNGEVIRPLISSTRAQTGAYCNGHCLSPRLDSTNLDTEAHLRNRVRLQLMPLLEADYAPGAEAAVLRLSEVAASELAWTGDLVGEAFGAARLPCADGIAMSLTALSSMHRGLLGRVLRHALAELARDLTGLGTAHVEALVSLVHGGATGSRVVLPFELCGRREYNALVLGPSGASADAGPWCVALSVPGDVPLPCGGRMIAEAPGPATVGRDLPPRGALLAADVAGTALGVRSWRHGDCIRPLGMVGTKKLQDLFVDQKVPRRERPLIPVVTNITGEVLWVAGHCVSRLAAITPETRQCIRLTWEPGERWPRPVDTT